MNPSTACETVSAAGGGLPAWLLIGLGLLAVLLALMVVPVVLAFLYWWSEKVWDFFDPF